MALEFVIFSTPLGKNPLRVEEGFSLEGSKKSENALPCCVALVQKSRSHAAWGSFFHFFQRLYGQTARNVRGVNVAVARAPVLLFGLCFPCSVALVFSQLMTPLAWEAFFFWGVNWAPLPTPSATRPPRAPQRALRPSAGAPGRGAPQLYTQTPDQPPPAASMLYPGWWPSINTPVTYPGWWQASALL